MTEGKQAEERNEETSWRAKVGTLRVWWAILVSTLAAAAAGGGALYLIYAERWSEHFIEAAMHRSPYLQAAILGVGMVVICRLRDLVFPGTHGTGIPQAIAALAMGESPARTGLLSMRIAFGKLFLLTLGLFAGATLGREGPSVHVAACLLYSSRRLATYPPHLLERGLILAGGAAGIAAAFNAPIAGIVFSIEEIGRSFDKRNAGTIIRTAAVACLVCIIPLTDYLFYGRVDVGLHTWQEWAAVPAIGLVGGFLGGSFALAVAVITPQVSRLGKRHPYLVAGALGLALAGLGLVTGGVSYGSGDKEVHEILRHGENLWSLYPLVKAGGNFIALISGIPGGLFTPSLSVGAGLGQLASQLAADFAPDLNRQAIILLAMGSYFSGVVQSPITAAVILFEMTGARLMILPLLIAAILAYEVSHRICRTALYESLAESFLRAEEAEPRTVPAARPAKRTRKTRRARKKRSAKHP